MHMETAIAVPNAVYINAHGTLPNGVGYIELAYDGTYDAFKQAPAGLKMNGRLYGKSSHNSDTYKIVYRTDHQFAVKP